MFTPIDEKHSKTIKPPPGPRNNPQAVNRLLTNPAPNLEAQARKYGDVSSISFGKLRLHLFNHPDLVKEVLQGDPKRFPRQKLMGRFKKRFDKGLFATSEGDQHRAQRKMIAAFVGRNPIREFQKESIQQANHLADSWQDGQVVDMRSEMAGMIAKIVCQALYSEDSGEEVLDIVRRFHDAHTDFGELRPPHAAFASVLRKGAAKRQYDAEDQLNEFTLARVRERREKSLERKDILASLMSATDEDGARLSDETIRAQMTTLFWASLESSTEALSWTWYVLDQNPEVQERVLAEIAEHLPNGPETLEDLDKLVYTRQVISETLRMYPPFWILTRVAGRTMKMDYNGSTYRLRRHEIVVLSQYLLNRDERFWPNPSKFDPDRFGPNRPTEISRTLFFPFGVGGHSCIGEGLSWMELLTIFSIVLPKWKATAASSQPVKVRIGFTLYAEGLTMKLSRR